MRLDESFTIMLDCVIRGGDVVTTSGRFEADVAIENGKIAQIGSDLSADADEVIDAAGKLVLPGAIDPHTHVEWPDWEWEYGAKAGGRAAAAGGVTTFINFLAPDPENTLGDIDRMRAALEDQLVDTSMHVDIFTHGQVEEVEEYIDEGVTTFKLLLPYRGKETAAYDFEVNDTVAYNLMERLGDLDVDTHVLVHPENVEPSFYLKNELREEYGEDVDRGELWDQARPDFLEADAISRIMLFAEETGCRTHFVHMSTAKGLRTFEANQPDMTTEVSAEIQIQHLTIDASEHGVEAKMNPPIRTATEHEPLWEGLRSGSIEFVSSDHAPTALEHKQNFWDATVGIPGLQTWFPLLLTEVLDEGHLSVPKMVAVSSYNAAKRFQLTPRKGGLWPGADADIVVVDPDERTTVRADELYDPSDYNLLEGRDLVFPELTMSRGEIIYQNGELLGEEGRSQFIERPVDEQ